MRVCVRDGKGTWGESTECFRMETRIKEFRARVDWQVGKKHREGKDQVNRLFTSRIVRLSTNYSFQTRADRGLFYSPDRSSVVVVDSSLAMRCGSTG